MFPMAQWQKGGNRTGVISYNEYRLQQCAFVVNALWTTSWTFSCCNYSQKCIFSENVLALGYKCCYNEDNRIFLCDAYRKLRMQPKE